MRLFENENVIKTNVKNMYLTNFRIKKVSKYMFLKNSKSFFISDLVSIDFKILVKEVYLILFFLSVFLIVLLSFEYDFLKELNETYNFFYDFSSAYFNSILIMSVVLVAFVVLFICELMPKLIFKTANDVMSFDVGLKQTKNIETLINTIEMQKHKQQKELLNIFLKM